MINDTRCEVDWKTVQQMNPENFPTLKYLELPWNSFFDYKTDPEYSLQVFSGLHINYTSVADNNDAYYNLLRNRYYSKSVDSDNRFDIPNSKLLFNVLKD